VHLHFPASQLTIKKKEDLAQELARKETISGGPICLWAASSHA
jgi:hypothetical protein